MASWQPPFVKTPKVSELRPPFNWTIAAGLAFAGAFNPLPIPITGVHKFYVGQPIWGGIYLLLGWTQIPRVACALEGIWFLSRAQLLGRQEAATNSTIPDGVSVSQQTQAIASALRELEKLRQEGLISEQEFECNRRNLLERLSSGI